MNKKALNNSFDTMAAQVIAYGAEVCALMDPSARQRRRNSTPSAARMAWRPR